MVLFLSNDQIRDLLSWSETLKICEDILYERVGGTAWFSPRQRFVLQSNMILLFLPGGAAKMNFAGTRIYSQQPQHLMSDQTANALNAHSVNVVFDMTTAEILAVTAGEWINTLRTVGIAAVGSKYIAKKQSKKIGLFGSSRLAFGSLMSLNEIYDVELVKVYSRNKQHLDSFCSTMSQILEMPVIAMGSPNEVVKGSDIITTATSSIEPVFDGRLLEAGTHVNCIGGYVQGGGRELDENAMSRFDVLAVLNKEHTMKGGAQDEKPNYNFKIAVEKGVISWDDVVEVSDIISEKNMGRRSDDDITLFDSRGMGAFDVGLAYHAYLLAKERGVGQELNWSSSSGRHWFQDAMNREKLARS